MDFILELIKQMGDFWEVGFVSYKFYRDVLLSTSGALSNADFTQP